MAVKRTHDIPLGALTYESWSLIARAIDAVVMTWGEGDANTDAELLNARNQIENTLQKIAAGIPCGSEPDAPKTGNEDLIG